MEAFILLVCMIGAVVFCAAVAALLGPISIIGGIVAITQGMVLQGVAVIICGMVGSIFWWLFLSD